MNLENTIRTRTEYVTDVTSYTGDIGMKTYMMTIPRTVHKRILKIMINKNDCKKWIIAKEKGHNGYEHWQVRLQTSNDGFFEWIKNQSIPAHVEECTDNWKYERKEGNFWCSDDTVEIRSVRFGEPNKWQRNVIKTIRTQSVRQIDVWYDPSGNHGKSWLALHLWEQGKAYLISRVGNDPRGLISDIASKFSTNGFRNIIIIDIPRSAKIPGGLYEAIETIKDGLIDDPRYHSTEINIRGVKVIIFTNTKLDTKKLSHDRWRLHGITESLT